MRTILRGLPFLALLFALPTWGQIFEAKGYNPFGLQLTKADTSEPAMRFIFYDLDLDGDKDAIIAGIDSIDQQGQSFTFKSIKYFVSVQENKGDRWNPAFESRQPAFPELLQMTGFVYPAAADFNGDKKPDFVVCCDADEYLNLSVRYFESKPGGGYNSFAGEQLRLNDFSAGSFFVPEIADMDQDGDFDIVMSGFVRYFGEGSEENDVATMLYAKNTGSPTDPNFVGWYQNTNGIAAFLNKSAFFMAGDLDLDDDVDLFSMWQDDINEDVLFIGGIYNEPLINGKANFVSAASFLGLPAQIDDAASLPTLVDLDGDRDLDVFLLENLLTDTMRISYYENISCTGQIDNTVTKSGSTLNANAIGVEYQWFNCNTGEDIPGATQRNFLPTTTGSYAVKLTDVQGCENISTCQSVVISATNDTQTDLLIVGPNPAKDYVLINFKGSEQIDRIQLFNADGRAVKELNGTGNMERLELSDVTAGQYLLEVTAGGQTTIRKIVVLRQ
ncbi:MAG: T9SS type A sorting domain-containing protein [Saprospiraceae bacterium]|nr:T9SS type A sorting domain-containing protein [Saprospiraceae bacterium]